MARKLKNSSQYPIDVKPKKSMLYLPSDPVYRIPRDRVDDEMLVDRAMKCSQNFRNDRMQFYQNRKTWMSLVDDYKSSIRKGDQNEYSNFHIPMIEPQYEAMRAQLLASIFFSGTPFHVSPGEEIDEKRVKKITNFMRYVVTRLANNKRGVFDAFYDFTTYLAVDGIGILSRDWIIDYSYYLDIERNDEYQGLAALLSKAKTSDMDQDEFEDNARQIQNFEYLETKKISTNEYPLIRGLPVDNVLFKGHSYEAMDLNSHDTVIEVTWLSKSQLQQMKATGVFGEDAVDQILSSKRDVYGSSNHSSQSSYNERHLDERTGNVTLNSQGDQLEEKYEFYKVYDKVCLDNNNKYSGIPSRLVYYVHGESRTLAGWNYLDRITASKKIPLHLSHLFRRPGRTIGFGLGEKLNQMSSLSDTLINHTIEAGMLANTPMFAWRADSNAFDPNEMRIEPGLGIRTEDPNSDIRMLNFNSNPGWTLGILQYIDSKVSQQSAIGAERFGQVAQRVGATRSNAGLQTLMSESDRLLNVIFKFGLAPCLSEFFTSLYVDSMDRFSDEELIPIIGMDGVHIMDKDGKPISDRIKRSDLSKNLHFVFNVTSAGLNKEIKKAEALEFFQFMSQPVFLKTGIFGAQQALSLAHYVGEQAYEINNIDRFINGNIDEMHHITYEAELMYIKQGMMPPVGLSDPEHEKKITSLNDLLNDAAFNEEVEKGILQSNVPKLIEVLIAKHGEMLAVQNSAQALQNPTGTNSPLTQQNSMGANSANQGNEASMQSESENNAMTPTSPAAPQGQPAPQEGSV